MCAHLVGILIKQVERELLLDYYGYCFQEASTSHVVIRKSTFHVNLNYYMFYHAKIKNNLRISGHIRPSVLEIGERERESWVRSGTPPEGAGLAAAAVQAGLRRLVERIFSSVQIKVVGDFVSAGDYTLRIQCTHTSWFLFSRRSNFTLLCVVTCETSK